MLIIDGTETPFTRVDATNFELDATLGLGRRLTVSQDGRVLLLWPGADSLPQRLLHLTEKAIHRGRGDGEFRFHLIPEEISQLRSAAEGREVLRRNGFRVLHVDPGLRTLLAFKTLVGAKP